MNHIGRTVAQKYGSILRFGIVMGQEEVDSWTHLSVRWANDEAQESAVAWRNKLTNRDYTRKLYRVDTILFIEPDKIASSLEKIQHWMSR